MIIFRIKNHHVSVGDAYTENTLSLGYVVTITEVCARIGNFNACRTVSIRGQFLLFGNLTMRSQNYNPSKRNYTKSVTWRIDI